MRRILAEASCIMTIFTGPVDRSIKKQGKKSQNRPIQFKTYHTKGTADLKW